MGAVVPGGVTLQDEGEYIANRYVASSEDEAYERFIVVIEERLNVWRADVLREEKFLLRAKQQLEELRKREGRGVFRWAMDEWAQVAPGMEARQYLLTLLDGETKGGFAHRARYNAGHRYILENKLFETQEGLEGHLGRLAMGEAE